MASAKKARNADPVQDAAVEYFAARSHNAWRRLLLKTNLKQKGKPRLRLRGGVMVDVNQPWAKLHRKAQADNKRAARDAYDAVKKFPSDREAAADYIHVCWMRRNKADPNQPKQLFKPYRQLPELEKDKDRAHVDRMKRALAAARKSSPRKRPKVKRAVSGAIVRIDAKTWRRLESAAKALQATLGHDVPPEVLAKAGIEAIARVCEAITAKSRSKRA